MGEIAPHSPVLLVTAAFSRYGTALEWGAEKMEQAFGPISLASDDFRFTQTDYYQPEMGPGLIKRLLAFERLIDPGDLPAIKRTTNHLEEEFAALGRHPERRPLNLDPGYLSLAKLVLASSKDHAHRIYLGQGVYGEVTLHFRRDQGWRPYEWTFPDYRQESYHAFFGRCRHELQTRRRGPQ